MYDRAAPSVALIYDITMRTTGPGGPQAVEQPEGNGSGWVFDGEGHIVTNYHVLASVLGGAAGKLGPSAAVARVLLPNREGVQQAFDGLLVGEAGWRDGVGVLEAQGCWCGWNPLCIGSQPAHAGCHPTL